jgi:hypothetical protein
VLTRRQETLLWVGVGLALVAVLELLPIPRQTILWRTAFDSGHIVVFAGFALALLRLANLWLPSHKPYLLAAVGIAACAIGTEGLQYFTARDADADDLMRDMVGGLAMLGFCYSFAARQPAWRAWLLRVVVVAVVVASLLPLLRCYYAFRVRAAAFPRVIAFESASERVFFDARSTTVSFSAGAAELVFRATGHEYPRFGTEVVSDWRGYERLHFLVRNPASAPVTLHLRIHDAAHECHVTSDRFNTEFVLAPGANQLEVEVADIEHAPATRTLDLASVKNLTLFVTSSARDITVLIDEVRLR